SRFDLDPGPPRQPLDRLGEGDPLDALEEGEDVAVGAAAEAVERPILRIDVERRRLLVVEGAEALQVAAGVFQLDARRHHLFDGDTRPDLVQLSLARHLEPHTRSVGCWALVDGAWYPRHPAPITQHPRSGYWIIPDDLRCSGSARRQNGAGMYGFMTRWADRR